MICYATGYNPWRDEKYATPNLTWAVPLDRDKLGLVLRSVLQKFLPKGTRYSKQEQMYVLPAPWNSRIQVIQQAAGREQFQGARIRAAWIDEECPQSQGGEEIFSEILARKEPGQDLDIHYTLTPMNGLDWTYRRILHEESPERYKNVEVFYASIYDAAKSHGGWYTDEEIEEIKNKYPPHEREARLEGKASVLSGSLYFNSQGLEKINEKGYAKPEYVRLRRGHLSALVVDSLDYGPLQVYERPKTGEEYIVGVDPSGGVRRDSSVAVVFNRRTLKCAAIYSDNTIEPDLFGAEVVLLLGMWFNEAHVVVESNNHGGTVLSQLRGRYNNLFVRQDWDSIGRGYKTEYGFRTDLKTRPRVLDALAKELRNERWEPPEQLVREMMTFVLDKDGKPTAMVGYQDDSVMAAGIALCVLNENPSIAYPSKKDYALSYSGDPALRWMAC